MVLSAHDPILARRVAHAAGPLEHIPARPAPLPMALLLPHRGNGSSSKRQQEKLAHRGPIRCSAVAVAPTTRARVRVVPCCSLTV